MKARGHGYILNVASIGAYVPSPYYAAYTAGKAYVRNLTEAVAYEARGSGVKITCLCPGPTTSEFLTTAGHKDLPAIGRLIFMSARRCAKIGLNALFGWRINVVAGWGNKLMMLSLRLVPRWLMIRIGALTMGRHSK
jgi:short-subunit dehydrogenase